MRVIKKVLKVLLCLCLVAVTVLSFGVTHNQNNRGGYSSATVCTQRARQFIVEKFGEAESVEKLLINLNKFACENFTYVKKGFYLQYFDIDQFIFEDEFHGLCWDFACFTKIAVLEISALKGWQNVEAYVCDVKYPETGDKHSFNFVSVGKTTYYMDNTCDNTRYKSGKEPYGVRRLLCGSKEEYLEINNIKLLNYH